MKKNIICLGLNKNQINLIKFLNEDFNIIGIDRILKKKAKIFLNSFYKSSIHNLDSTYEIAKKIIKKKIEIHSIIYRSSGPTILSAALLEKIFNIRRINNNLKNSIYSKSYFSNYLKRNGIKSLPSKKIKNFSVLRKRKNYVLKPDAPIYGKKNIFFIQKNFSSLKFFKCKKESHNNDVNYSNFFNGKDISSFYLVDGIKKSITLLSHTQEFNDFKKGKILPYGLCSPPIIQKKYIKKKEKIDKSIIKLFSGYYGIMSISSKILKNQIILPYEVNIGLSADKFADHIFPYLFKNRSLYEIEIDMALFKTKKNIIYNTKKFIGFFKNRKILSKKIFLKKISEIDY